jgi:hypothetical protein
MDWSTTHMLSWCLLKRDCEAVILDLGLPDIDALDLREAAREANVIAPVLGLSARAAVDPRVHASCLVDLVARRPDRRSLELAAIRHIWGARVDAAA